MLPLAKLWTWIGTVFVPLAIGWMVYVRGGMSDSVAETGILISRGYWGLLATLIAGSALTWTLLLYVRLAKKSGQRFLVPPNTTFEDSNSRNIIVSSATLIVYIVVFFVSLAVFSVRYSDSNLHSWDSVSPLKNGFLLSRVEAHSVGCKAAPCYAVFKRVQPDSKPISGVLEYVLYYTDGAIIIFVIIVLAGIFFVGVSFFSDTPARRIEL